MQDVKELSQLHAVRAIGELIRRRWGLWCGLLAPDGEAIPIGASHAPVELPACVHLKTRGDERGSCASSVRRWAAAGVEGDLLRQEVAELRCHAGLTALLRPVEVDGEVLATFYASGFWRAEADEVEEGAWLSRRLRALGIEGVSASTPQLDSSARAWVGELMDAACREIGRYVAQQRRQGRSATRRQVAGRRYAGIIGQSAPVMELFRLLDKVASSDSTVLIQGENGTGKELIARAVHFHSRRRERPFVVQNCSALNDNLLDSELFGHKKGSFTGAVADKQGLFAIADGGTFFLDEVGDMSPTLQVKMLRVLQEGTFLPVGDTVVRRVDVRIIAATNRPLKAMVREGTFREDLYYRLNVINIAVPALRERREDIKVLAEHFLRQVVDLEGGLGPRAFKRLSAAALRRLMSYSWPGNVRELENEIERLVVLAGDVDEISEALLSPRVLSAQLDPTLDDAPRRDLPGALETLERRMLLESLRRTGWNKTRTAQELGISRRNLIRKVDRYDLEKLRES